MEYILFQQLIKNITGKEVNDYLYSTNVQKLNTHYSNQFGMILKKCSKINAKIVESTAMQLLQEQWLSEGKCMHCGQLGEMYTEYCCIGCNLRMYPTLDREQKQRANRIAENPKKYHELEILWAEKILKTKIVI